jgi:hypothetical protein
MKGKRKVIRALKPVNGDARAFLRPASQNPKVPLRPGHLLCEFCGEEFDNQGTLSFHCANFHKKISKQSPGIFESSSLIRCNMCDSEMNDTPDVRRSHIWEHGILDVERFCKANGVTNPFRKLL